MTPRPKHRAFPRPRKHTRAFFFSALLLFPSPAACVAGNTASPAGEASDPRTEIVNPKDGYRLVRIPAGDFLMGSPDGEGNDNEHPRHKVFLDGYSIGKYEVTVGQYRRYRRENGGPMPDQMGHGDADPVIDVTWENAAAYCAWAGLRLPTEAEWEKAARGGTATTYWWGDVPSHNRANYTGKAGKDVWDDASPVGSFPPNPFGLHDTAGNVWEWVADRYGTAYYAESPDRNPKGPETGESRVMRGGCWDSPADFLRSAHRDWDAPGYSSTLLGFRCAGGK